MSKHSVFVYHDEELRYKFNEQHPFNQKRLQLTIELLQASEALSSSLMISPFPAEDHELLRIHEPSYVDIIKALSAEQPAVEAISKAKQYGLHTEDTPYFPHMHEVTKTIVGGSMLAAELVMSGQAKHALHLGGGLHHAMPNQAAGFCIYNDAAIAISHIREHYGGKVLYIDTDVHHGDGVQFSFYPDPNVCTFSIHETGKYLFPGTGAVNDRGVEEGFGRSINLPVEPYTEDDSWMECFSEVLAKTIEHFKPDLIISQHGCDAHAFDPLAHIHCSMSIYQRMPALIHQWAHEACDGRWVALGGGGYDIWRVVPRAWSLLWLTMTEHPLIHQLQSEPLMALPGAWLDKWANEAPIALPSTWLDDMNAWEPMPRRQDITEKNRKMKEIALLYL